MNKPSKARPSQMLRQSSAPREESIEVPDERPTTMNVMP